MVQKQNVEFTAKDDVILRGWLFVPDGPGPHPAITMAHGFAGVKEHGLERFAQVFAAAGLWCWCTTTAASAPAADRRATTSTRGCRSPTGAGRSPSWRADPS